jgi:hypothetical protein
VIEERIKAYMDKLESLDAERDNLKADYYMQARIEAHLEMLCLLGFMEVLEQTKKKKG